MSIQLSSSCKRTAPIRFTANLKDLLKSGANKTGVFPSMSFKLLEACWHLSDQTNFDFLLKDLSKVQHLSKNYKNLR